MTRPRLTHRDANRRQQGFTLLEAIVALAIFSVIGLGSWQVLNRVLQTNEHLAENSAALADLQRGMWILARDIHNLARRPIRNEYHAVEPLLTTLEPGYALVFTRNGWHNPLNQPRGPLQRVAYSIGSATDGGDQTHLLRSYWPVLDRANGIEPYTQVLIPNINYLEVAFIDRQKIPRSHWPAAGHDDKSLELPSAIIVRLGTARHGEIERVFSVSELGDDK